MALLDYLKAQSFSAPKTVDSILSNFRKTQAELQEAATAHDVAEAQLLDQANAAAAEATKARQVSEQLAKVFG